MMSPMSSLMGNTVERGPQVSIGMGIELEIGKVWYRSLYVITRVTKWVAS